ncbi:MAG: DUF2066 domain-containing protein [Marinobacter sp.]|uniref:DUF2066 domain-containing protein n=1 Tax=Marinobacter sp. TaxID=50741 RepID=UPI00299E4255|nr:DUF2066 domain-containing protein [Marinobacter sp.]MDX1757456.1 DUF2066 domain-containing protein [Marinobacter sp.]
MPEPGQLTTPVSRITKQVFLLLLVLFGLHSPAQAVTVDGLYTVEVPVAGSLPQQLQAGYAEGLRRVLVRVSGSSEVLQREEVGEVLQRAESLLQSYQFLRGENSGAGGRLRMTFGSVGVNQALSSIQAPVWGANRPLTLAWIAVQTSSGRQLVTAPEQDSSAAPSSRWYRAFQAAAASRGLPLTMPPQSVAGNRALLSEVWGQFMGRIREESETIGHNLLASVRISFERNAWRASWLLEGRGVEAEESSLTASSPEQLAQRIVAQWADMLAARYAVAAGEVGDSPQVDIVLDEVDSLEDYADATAALNKLTPVQNVGAINIKARQATLRVAFSGELSQLQEYMALDARFVPVQPTPSHPETVESPQTEGTPTGPNPAAPAPPVDAGQTTDTSGQSVEADDLFSYQPLAVEDAEAEKAFESLYPILHYRWQAAPAVRPGGQE